MAAPANELMTTLDVVTDAKTFLTFVRALIADRESAAQLEGADGLDGGDWQNIQIETYLECAVAWAVASDFGVSQGLVNSDNLWSRFANFLYAGKIYE